MALRAALLSFLQGRVIDFDYLWEVRFKLVCAVVSGHDAFMHNSEEPFEHGGEPIVPSEDFLDIESLTRLNHVARLLSRWLGDEPVNDEIPVVGELVQYTDNDGRLQNRNWGQLVEELYNLVQREGYSRDLDATMDGLVLCVFCLAHYGDDDAYFGQFDVLGGPVIRHFARMFLLSLGGPPQNQLVDVATQVEVVAEAIDVATQVDAHDLEEAEGAEAEAGDVQEQHEPNAEPEEPCPQQPYSEEVGGEVDVSTKVDKRKRQSEIVAEEDEVHDVEKAPAAEDIAETEALVDEDGDVVMETGEMSSARRGPKRRCSPGLSYNEESSRTKMVKKLYNLRSTRAREERLTRLKEAEDSKRKAGEAESSSEGSRKRSKR